MVYIDTLLEKNINDFHENGLSLGILFGYYSQSNIEKENNNKRIIIKRIKIENKELRILKNINSNIKNGFEFKKSYSKTGNSWSNGIISLFKSKSKLINDNRTNNEQLIFDKSDKYSSLYRLVVNDNFVERYFNESKRGILSLDRLVSRICVNNNGDYYSNIENIENEIVKINSMDIRKQDILFDSLSRVFYSNEKIFKDYMLYLALKWSNNSNKGFEIKGSFIHIYENGIIDENGLCTLLEFCSLDGIFFDKIPLQYSKELIEKYSSCANGLNIFDFNHISDMILNEYLFFYENGYYTTESIGPFIFGSLIKKGSSGKVWNCINVQDGNQYAIKVVNRNSSLLLSQMDKEVYSLLKLKDHENIIDIKEILIRKKHLFIVTELCYNICLEDFIFPGHNINQESAIFIFERVLSAIDYCHDKEICHRDINLNNILIGMNNKIKLCDFGHSQTFEHNWDIFDTALVGGIYNIAPELMMGKPYSGRKLDSWSIGILFFMLVVGRSPFNLDLAPEEYLRKISECEFDIPDFVSDFVKETILLHLKSNPSERISIKDSLSRLSQNKKVDIVFQGNIFTTKLEAKEFLNPLSYFKSILEETLEEFCDSIEFFESIEKIRVQPIFTIPCNILLIAKCTKKIFSTKNIIFYVFICFPKNEIKNEINSDIFNINEYNSSFHFVLEKSYPSISNTLLEKLKLKLKLALKQV